MASNTNNLEMCKSLIDAVPKSLTNEFKSAEPSKKSPLHFAVKDNFPQLGEWLLTNKEYGEKVRPHCLFPDGYDKIPMEYMPTEKSWWERVAWNGVNSREGGQVPPNAQTLPASGIVSNLEPDVLCTNHPRAQQRIATHKVP